MQGIWQELRILMDDSGFKLLLGLIPIGACATYYLNRSADRRKVRKIEDLIYRELVENFMRLNMAAVYIAGPEDQDDVAVSQARKYLAILRTDAYSDAYAKNREILMSMRGYSFVREFYERIQAVKSKAKNHRKELPADVLDLISIINGAKATGLIEVSEFDRLHRGYSDAKAGFAFIQADIERMKTEKVIKT